MNAERENVLRHTTATSFCPILYLLVLNDILSFGSDYRSKAALFISIHSAVSPIHNADHRHQIAVEFLVLRKFPCNLSSSQSIPPALLTEHNYLFLIKLTQSQSIISYYSMGISSSFHVFFVLGFSVCSVVQLTILYITMYRIQQ